MRHKKLTVVVLLMALVSEYVTKGDNPLLLTPYLERGDIETAQTLSLVSGPILKGIPRSHAGFITVNQTVGNHLFFWFFPYPKAKENVPLLVWLNGGPGASSMLGLLWENGPVEISDSKKPVCKKRKCAWTKHFSMLYVDNPVGVGYSFTDSGDDGYRLTQEGYTLDMYNFMEQFYLMFPEYLARDLYIGGQSFAGKYVPSLAHYIDAQIQAGESEIPLTGIYVGGAYFDPLSQGLAFFEYIFALGVISDVQKTKSQSRVQALFDRYDSGELSASITSEEVNAILLPAIGLPSLDNIVTGQSANYEGVDYVMKSEDIRSAIHVGDLDYTSFNVPVFQLYGIDTLVSARSELAVVMDRYKTLLFSGDYDVIVSGAMVEAALMSTPWSGQAEYNSTFRSVWMSEESQLRGFYSQTGQFCRVVVHGAGHQTPHDQPASTLDMMLQFVYQGCIQESPVSNSTA